MVGDAHETMSAARELYWMLQPGSNEKNMPAKDYALKQRSQNPKALSPILRLQPPGCLPRLRPPQLRRPIIWLRLLGPPDGTRTRHGFTPQIWSVGSPRGAVHDGPVSLAGRGVGPKV